MDVRVGIVSWQTASLLDQCLSALPAALARLTSEVVVVDNASSDDSAGVARRHGVQVVVNNRNVGYPRAINQALSGTDAPFLIALNPDSSPHPGSLEVLVERLRAERRLGLVAPRLLNIDGSLQHSVHRFPSVAVALAMGLVPMQIRRGSIGQHFWLEGFADHTHPQDIDWAIGAVHVIRRAALDDPDHAYPEWTFMYAEDMALCWILRRSGWQIALEPSAEVTHAGGAAAVQAFGRRLDSVRLAADYEWYGRVHGRTSARAWAAANVLGYGTKLIVGRAVRPARDPRTERSRQFLRLHARHLRAGRGERSPRERIDD